MLGVQQHGSQMRLWNALVGTHTSVHRRFPRSSRDKSPVLPMIHTPTTSTILFFQ